LIKETVITAIDKFGTEGVITEYESEQKHIVKGILQPINNNTRRYSDIDYTNAGAVNNENYLFLFNLPKDKVDYSNAVVWLHQHYYWVRDCTAYYFNGKPIYMRAVLSPYKRK